MLNELKKSMENALVTNIIWSFLAKIFAMLFYFIADVFYARFLGINLYAEWVFFFSVANMAFRIVCFGINISSKVNIAKSTEREQCFGAALGVRMIVSSIMFVVIVVTTPFIADKIGFPHPYPDLKLLMYIMSGMAFLYSFTEFFKQLYIGIQDLKRICIITFIEYFSYCFFTIALLLINNNPTSIAFGYCAAGTIVLIYNLLTILKKYKIDLVSKGIRNIQLQKKILKYAMPFVLTTLGSLILLEMDTFMLGLFSTKQQVSVYSIAKQLISKATNVNMAIWTGTTASLAMITENNFKEKKHKFRKVSRLNNTVSIIICICFALFGGIAIKLVYGDEYSAASKVLFVLIPYYFLYCMSSLYADFLDFMGHTKTKAYWYISVIAINLTFNYLLIPKYGAIGAAVATIVSILPYLIYCIYAVRKIFKNKTIPY